MTLKVDFCKFIAKEIIMVIEFAVENFKSFKNLQILSLQADDKSINLNNSIAVRTYDQFNNLEVLKSKAIFGANGSGKSNLIQAFSSFWQIIRHNLSSSHQEINISNDLPILTDKIRCYKLDQKLINKPTYFQIIILADDIQYRYGFEADFQKIYSEWLFKKKKSERKIFIREDQKIIYAKPEIKDLLRNNKLYKPNTLVLSVLDAFNNKDASKVAQGILSNISIHTGQRKWRDFWKNESIIRFTNDDKFKVFTKNLLKSIDDTIIDFDIINSNNQNRCLVKRKSNSKKVASFDLEYEEAEGTNKLFSVAYVLYDALKFGRTFIIDEFDSFLHPKLTRKIISLFHSELAHLRAQILFISHDSNLLDHGFLKRDQITFVEKLKSGESEIYDLSDIKGVRPNDLFEKNYLSGKYGGLPHLGNLEKALINA